MKKSFWKFSQLSILLMLFPAYSSAGMIQANDESKIDYVVENVLISAENALHLVSDDPSTSLSHVEDAIASILSIREQYSQDVHVKNKSPLIVNDTKEYWFVYPNVKAEILSNKSKFPTIYSKFSAGVLYQGQNHIENETPNAYFDYAFAHASLITAREALVAENTREAISSIKWVFEAIYVSPDFYIAEYDGKQMMDRLINMKGQYPLVSNSN